MAPRSIVHLFAAATFLAAVAVVPAVRAEEPGPVETAAVSANAGAKAAIARFNATLLDIMKRADQLGYEGRYQTVAPVLRDTFDVPFMAAKTVGRTWRTLDAEQRRRWVEAFEGYTVSNFADRFDGFSGETLEIVGEKPASHQTRVILTLLTRPGDDDVELNYRMRETDDGWQVVDIYSDGTVSEIALRRSEYAAVLKQGGIEKLIASVNAKTAERARSD
jgi:phospholipid transport system substrate-binding protein